MIEALRLMLLKQPDVVKPARVVEVVQVSKPDPHKSGKIAEPAQQEPNLLDQFGWDDSMESLPFSRWALH